MNDLPDAATCHTATKACLCDGLPDWILHGTQQTCNGCGSVRSGVVEVGATWEEEVEMQEEQLCMETDDRKIFCLLPCKARGQCAHCLHLYETKPMPVRNMLTTAHESILMDPKLHGPLATNVAHLASLVEIAVYTLAQLVQSKDVNTKTIRSMRKTMSTAAASFATRLKDIQSSHLLVHNDKSDLTYLKLGELSVAIKARGAAVQKAVTIGELLQAGRYAAQVKNDLVNYLADKEPQKKHRPASKLRL